MKYDIFISYRREGGKEIARTLKAELDRRGYSVFLDFDELRDGVFDTRILKSIDEAPIFMIILSKHALDRCVNDGDWVRKEIEYAAEKGKHIIPVNPDCEFGGMPAGIPESIEEAVGKNQFSEIMLGSLFRDSIDKMEDERISKIIKKSPKKALLFSLLGIVAAAIVAAGAFGLMSVKAQKEAEAAAAEYDSIVADIRALLSSETTVNSADPLLDKADSIRNSFAGTSYSTLFGIDSEILRQRQTAVRDSLYKKYKTQYDRAFNLYLEEFNDKYRQEALECIDKALQFKKDQGLISMKKTLVR
ncbi:MAG: toll/interleukin-1 receptor domain-containing protein [Candidatus Cryptobacteroides sp.]